MKWLKYNLLLLKTNIVMCGKFVLKELKPLPKTSLREKNCRKFVFYI